MTLDVCYCGTEIRFADVLFCFQNGKLLKEPVFSRLTYADAGLYVCELSMTGLTQHQSFELVVEGER